MQATGAGTVRAFMVAVLLLSSACAKRVCVDTPPEITTQRLIEFNEAYLKFFKAYFGCPEWAREMKDCKGPAYGQWDIEAQRKARNARLF